MLTICIAGKNEIAVRTLWHVRENYPEARLVAIPNSTDPGYDTWQPSFSKACQELRIEKLALQDLYNEPNLVFLSLEFDKIIKPNLFKDARLYNIHFSLLPKYRGMYTAVFPIFFGDPFAGVTLHEIDDGIDTGPIIDQSKFAIPNHYTSRDLYFKFNEVGVSLLEASLPAILNERVICHPQIEANSSYFSKQSIDFSNISIDWNKAAREVVNQIRAFTFWEYQVIRINTFPVQSCVVSANRSSLPPGQIVSKSSEFLHVSSLDFDVEIRIDKRMQLLDAVGVKDIDGVNEAVSFLTNLDFRNSSGWSPLIVAAYSGFDLAVDTLLRAGADPNFPNYKGTTPLMYGLDPVEKLGNLKPIQSLLSAGAVPTSEDFQGKNWFDYVKSRNLNSKLSSVLKDFPELDFD